MCVRARARKVFVAPVRSCVHLARRGFQMSKSQQRRIIAAERIADTLMNTTLTTLPITGLVDIYQFGVLTGDGLRAWHDTMPLLDISIENANVFGFDSFSGMPFEDPEFMRPMHQKSAEWKQGGLNAATRLGTSEWPQLRARVINNSRFPSERVHLIRGFYNESLRGGRALAQNHGMRPALLLDIDCDLYTSSKQALTFMLKANLLRPGSFVYYDDYSLMDWNWRNTSHPYREERRAHAEVELEWGLTWRHARRIVYRGPRPELDWIRQWNNGSRFHNHWISDRDMVPVMQLVSCARCSP